MKTIKQFFSKHISTLCLLAIITCIIIVALLANNCDKPEPVIVYQQNPELLKINEELQSQIFERESKILVLQTKIENLEKTKKQQSWNLSNSTQNLESEIIEVVEVVRDSTLIFLLDRVKIEQKNLIKTYENIVELKNKKKIQNDRMIQSYVIATDKLSDEIEILHAKNNELLINDSRNKSKIKKRNRIIVVGGSIVAAGIAGVILLTK